MDKDVFINTKNNPMVFKPKPDDDDNFFIQSENSSLHNVLPTEPSRRLNDYDSNILKEGAYREVDDEIFKLEYKISRAEDELRKLDKQIQAATDIYDYYLVDSLNARKIKLSDELKMLTEIYNEASLSAKISGGFTSKFKDGLAALHRIFSNNLDMFISKLPGKFSSFFAVKNSLTKLESINKSVDDLMKCQYPYGEAADRYEQLSRYIAKANSIQSEIYKFMK